MAGFDGFSASKNEEFFILGKDMDNVRGSIIDLIIAEEGNPASGCFGGQFEEVTDRYWVTSLRFESALIYALRFAY